VLTNTSYTQTNVTTVSWVTLPGSSSINANTFFPSCLYPDIAGTYVLGLSVSDGCQTVVTNLTLQASCNAAPTITLNVSEHANFSSSEGPSYVSAGRTLNTWVVSLLRSAPRRIVLDARASVGYSNSRLTYYWAWNSPDPRAGTINAQDSIETPYASTSALTLSSLGNYTLTLTVHDGCIASTLNFTIMTTCADPAPSFSPSSVTTNGKTYSTIRLYGSQTDCSINSWTIFNFTTVQGTYSQSAVTSGVSSRRPSIVIFALLLTVLFAKLR